MLILHVVISLVAIALGAVFFYGLLVNQRWPLLAGLFLVSNLLTSLSGVVLPADRFMPSHAFVVLCLVSLGLAGYGLYGRGLAGRWRPIYVVGSLFALYLNVVVLGVQSFDKFKSLPPALAGPLQLVALLCFLILGLRLVRRFQA